MEYNIKDVEKTFNCRVVGRTSKGDFKLDMDALQQQLAQPLFYLVCQLRSRRFKISYRFKKSVERSPLQNSGVLRIVLYKGIDVSTPFM